MNNSHEHVIKSKKITTNSTTEQTEIENIKSTERQKTSFLKEYVDNRDLFKLVLNKIMTPHEKSVKGNFATPLSFLVLNLFIRTFSA